MGQIRAPLSSLRRHYRSFYHCYHGKVERSALSWKYYDILLARVLVIYVFIFNPMTSLKNGSLPLFELILLQWSPTFFAPMRI